MRCCMLTIKTMERFMNMFRKFQAVLDGWDFNVYNF